GDAQALVDASTGDDAAVYLLEGDPNRALVVSVDFFTPMVDDPEDFGRIAATNAVSDLYAMGAKPLFALNLLGFPRDLLDTGLAERVIAGAAEAAREMGLPILGGHSIDDPEPKFGMVAVGQADPAALVTNAGARSGDRLVLTKPLGTGIVTTAAKNDAVGAATLATAVASMTRPNASACEAMLAVGVHAATDVTGFGLLGHLRSLLRASGCEGVVHAETVPLLPEALELARAGQIPGGSRRNREDLGADLDWAESIDDALRTVLCDAQTSGGLLISVAGKRLDELLEALARSGDSAAVIGTVRAGPRPGHIDVV
ncbi:MAG: selenide, water dikinase SelD, partial [Gemmatimonadetes bacterium]|nr:selenide, water dikinase SelD [Gemmatimonadota bacterium]